MIEFFNRHGEKHGGVMKQDGNIWRDLATFKETLNEIRAFLRIHFERYRDV